MGWTQRNILNHVKPQAKVLCWAGLPRQVLKTLQNSLFQSSIFLFNQLEYYISDPFEIFFPADLLDAITWTFGIHLGLTVNNKKLSVVEKKISYSNY